MIYTKDQFLKLFTLNKNISFRDFSKQISVLNGSDTSGKFVVRSSLNDFVKKNATKQNDTRLQRLNLYKKNMYRMLVQEPEVALSQWFDRIAEITEPLDFYFQLPADKILTDHTFAGRANSKYGRICKNINFEQFFNTRKLYANDFEYTFGLMRVMFEDFKIRNSLAAPAFFDHICKIKNSNYGQFWTDFMMGANRASVFNPVTYKGILDELLPGKTLFAPCMGWNSYQLAFYSSNFDHFVATDVIPEVVNHGRELHQHWQDYKKQSLFEIENKTVKLYCCPSETLHQETDMVATYQNQVDAVLFSPPYFDLEIYPSDNQSLSNYPDYNDWLKNYWEATVINAKRVLKTGGRFAFVISNYRNKAKQEVTISEDMMKIVDTHLKFIDRYRVQWSAIGGGRQPKKTRDGNFEDLWLFEK
jgi:SAM-dependent methyltransferase